MRTILRLSQKTIFALSTFVKRAAYITNSNLAFQDHHHHLQFFVKQKTQTYKINQKSNSLSLSFTPKPKPEDKTSQIKPKGINFSLQYQQLSNLLNIQQDQTQQIAIQRKKLQDSRQQYQWLTINYLKKHNELNIKIKQFTLSQSQSIDSLHDLIDFKLEYSNYKMIQLLIQNSLYELSGIGTIFEVKKIEDIEKINKISDRDNSDFDKQIKEFYK